MKKIVCFTSFLGFFFCLVSCEKQQLAPNPNKISLEYQGLLIDFGDIKIEDSDLELDGGIGPRAFGTSNMEDINGFNYYILLDYRKDSLGKYFFHKINFGINEKRGARLYHNKVYYASLTDGYNNTNFSHTISANGLKAQGSFSGTLQSIAEGNIEVKNGSFDLDFNTIRDY
ncbi:hypothetical protein HNQ92_001825 [Rhabdobacter roseus]|uniref:Uncharacterized protein n=1 Tax=Rhabdobacter roseus TaxID=1655419 RepID=A0A840TVL1_9BACT|nr:hypothetical protein [Rhabdobacter roseus]MBB5283699.1 hypothetical protein [Rhabdobacter roseus]